MTILLTSALMLGCEFTVTGSGDLDTREMDFDDFTRIEARQGFQVEVIRSDSYSVVITADDNLFDDHIRVSRGGPEVGGHHAPVEEYRRDLGFRPWFFPAPDEGDWIRGSQISCGQSLPRRWSKRERVAGLGAE